MKNNFSILLSLCLITPIALIGLENENSPAVVVQTFHEALASGAKERVLELLDSDVLIFESGGAELSRSEYSFHHLGADMEFSAATRRKIVDQQVITAADAAWVLTRSVTTGTFRQKELDILGAETIVLRRGDQGWRIVHIHWSSRPNRSDESPEQASE